MATGKVDAKVSIMKDLVEIVGVALTSNGELKLQIFCPFLIKNVLKIKQIDHLEMKLAYVFSGNEMLIKTTCNLFKDIQIVAKMTPTVLTYELLVGEVSHMKHTTEVIGYNDLKTNTFLTSVKMNIHLHENSFLYKMLHFISPSYVCFNDLTAYYELNVADKAAGKVAAKVSFLKDLVEIGQVAVTTIEGIKFEMMIYDAPLVYMSVASIGEQIYEVRIYNIPLIHLVLGDNKISIVPHTKFFSEFSTVVSWSSFSILENTISIELLHKKVSQKVIFNWNMNKLTKALVEVELLGSGTTLLGDFIIPLVHFSVASIGEQIYEVKIFYTPLIQLVLSNNKISIVPQIKVLSAITTVITWKSFSIRENTISIQLLFKKVSHTVLFTWNLNKLAKAFVEVKVLGSGAPMVGEYELFHHLNWNIVNLMNMDLIWNGKAVATGLTYLTNPY